MAGFGNTDIQELKDIVRIPKGSVAVLKKCTVTFGGVEDE